MPSIQDTLIDVLQIVRHNLDAAINQLAPTPDDFVVLSNIAFAENPTLQTPGMQKKVVITLVKTEEESALKNQPAYYRNPTRNNLEYRNPPIFLNLYLLITANYSDYILALTQLSRVIGYFQYKRVFTDTDAEVQLPTGSPVVHFDFNVTLVSPSFEQTNHMWSILGGKHLPSVLYKMQVVQMVYVPEKAKAAPLIETIQMQEKIY